MKTITAGLFVGVLAVAVCLCRPARAKGPDLPMAPIEVPVELLLKQAACARVMEALPAIIIVEEVKISARPGGIRQLSDCETEMAGGPAYQKDELIQAVNTAVKLMKPYCEAGDTQTALRVLGNIKGTQRYECAPFGWHGYGVSRINTGLDILAKTLKTPSVYDTG